MARSGTVRGEWLVVVALVALVVGGAVGALSTGSLRAPTAEEPATGNDSSTLVDEKAGVETFDSRAAFRAYLREAEPSRAAYAAQAGGAAGAGDEVSAERETSTTAAAAPSSADAGDGGGAAQPRTSRTNVQVEGIDEPDLLKTASDALFYSNGWRGPVVVGPRERDASAEREEHDRGRTHLLNASDPAAPEVAATLNVSGRLLLVGDTLVVFEGDRLVGFDVANRSNPERLWTKQLSGRVVTARLYQGHVYLVTAQDIDRDRPCPVEPVEGGEVACSDVHHPRATVPVDTTYVVTVLNPGDGSVDDTAAFVGSARQSATYMSPNAVYLTYTERASQGRLLLEFFLQNQSDVLDEATLDHLRELRGYDISDRALRYEVMSTYQQWVAGLNESRRREVRAELQTDLRAWSAAHKREFQRTGIVEFAVRNPGSASPSVTADDVGSVPGTPLDQFSLDEHEGHLRIATTVSGGLGGESANDVYVLDESMDVVGSVQGMGLTERIYSVRFVGDEAYVVTFRRIDPFHVLDLSDPQEPTLEGTLKLPGYSSYLHPLSEDRVLGIGEEDGNVKLVVFDVSNPSNPTIADSRVLDARWSAVARSHHAFLRDPRHGVFFLPTSETGLVYRYEDGLERVTRIEVEGQARRAAYIGDYLYVFGDGVTVVDERDWERVETVQLTQGS